MNGSSCQKLCIFTVRTLHENHSVPVTCKIRVFDDVNRTIKYALVLEKTGARDTKEPDFRKIVQKVAEKYKLFHEGLVSSYSTISILNKINNENSDVNVPDFNLKIPSWLCQTYYRKSPEEREKEKTIESEMNETEKAILLDGKLKRKKQYYDREGDVTSKKNMKKLKRLEKTAKIKREREGIVCETQYCGKNQGKKCVYEFCGNCCKEKCLKENVACVGHIITITAENDAKNNNMKLMEVEEEAEH